MTAPLKWRSQLCPCGYCPDGTRIFWRYTLDIRFRPRRRPEMITAAMVEEHNRRVRDSETGLAAAWTPEMVTEALNRPPRAPARVRRKALGGP